MAEGWKVTSQRETSVINGGQFTASIAVTFQTTAGTVGTVTIPRVSYSADAVKDAINAYVAKLNDVESL